MKNENPFKEKLYHHTIPVSDDLWKRIESELPPQVDKKKFPFYLLILATIILTAGIIFFMSQRSKDIKEIAPDQDTYPAPIDKPATLPMEVSSEEALPLIEDQDAIQIGHTSLVSAAFSENSSHNQSNSNSKSKSNSNKSASTTPDQDIVLFTEDATHVNSSAEASDHTRSPNEYLTKRSLAFTNNVPALPSLNISSIGSETLESEEFTSLHLSIKPDPSCYKFTGVERKSNLSIDLFSGPGFGPRSFKHTSTESALYAQARKHSESSRYALAAGGRVNYNLNDEIAFRVGFIYTLTGDVFNHQDSGAYRIEYDTDSTFSSNGTFLYVDTLRTVIPGTQVKRIHNRYHHIDVPLLVSYELPMGRAKLMVNAGPVINLSSSARGQILDPMMVPRHITEDAPNQLKVYKDNVGLSLYLGAGALLPITKQISGLIEPRFLYRIKPVTIDSYPLKEHRHYAGINLGIRYHFD